MIFSRIIYQRWFLKCRLSVCTLLFSCIGCVGGGSLGNDAADGDYDSLLVINELMVNNRTGLCGPDGEPADWVEIKRLADSDDRLTASEFTLVVKKNNGKENSLPITWKQGEGIAVFFVKLPKEGACVQLLSPNGDVVSEVTYPTLAPDESYARGDDGSFEATRWQSPGFDNDASGYEAYCQQMDDVRVGPLLIWEVFSRAEKRKDCWVELKNVSDSTIDLTGYALVKKNQLSSSSNPLNGESYYLSPGKTIVIPFKLGDAETVILTKDGQFIDGVCAKQTYYGTSMGRVDGRKGLYFFAAPTCGRENTAAAYRFISKAPQLMRKGTKGEVVALLGVGGGLVHYTLDGSLPTSSSPVLTDTLTIHKTTVVRAYAEGDSMTLRSPITTTTFLIDEPDTLPVVSIAIDEADLYDFNRGIYADGPGYSPQWPHKGANFWKSWTRNAHVELIEGSQRTLASDCGLKIFGGFSRYEAKKSFTVKFKNCYGNSSFTHDFFATGSPTELHDLVLRSGSQDWNRCMIRDEFFTSLMAEHCPSLLIQAYRPVSLYVNGGYFGLYFLREKIDKHFVARKLSVSEDSITIIASNQYLEEGQKAPFTQLMNYIRSHSMADVESYEYVKARVDLQGLIDYKLGEIYSGNTDVGNVRMVRSADAGCDGRWYFVFYDLDASWTGNKPTASYYLLSGSDAQQGGLHNRMIGSLLANPDFRQLFLERLSFHMHNTFEPKHATAVFDALVGTIRPDMQRNCERWPQLSYRQWEKNIEAFRARFADRHLIVLNDLRRLLSITPDEDKRYFSDLPRTE